MDFFCVRKARHAGEKQYKKGTRKHKEQTSLILFEARARDDPTRNTERSRQTRRKSRAVQPHRNLPALDMDEFPFGPRAPTHNHVQDANQANPTVPQGQGQGQGQGPAQQIQQTRQRFHQIYVHPYSSHHYRFSVVNLSIMCHGSGPGPTAHPVCSFALVPEVAAMSDIESALGHRPGLVTMARLRASGLLVHINTFQSIRALHEASLQLEVRESDNNVDDAPMLGNRGAE
ncbi:hypothetical protein FHL15_009854 [Xylaria flabelliformis]|uniref:Uncharacterized protein n=1 Tax=Xylaria flabelliformis TaxID=2512241 RepID=A0A553HMW0_9PEZI|nr:hypothetical protein FHL15_009854 [Xylaria flabelliformis]